MEAWRGGVEGVLDRGMPLTITLATPAELGAIYAADRLCFPGDDPVNVHAYKWWIARCDGVWAGYGGAKALGGHNAGMVFLSRVGVLPDFRGRGIQRALIVRRCRWAWRIRSNMVVTYTSCDNLVSANNLIHSGFTLYRPVEEWGTDGALYFRRLRPGV